MKVLVTGGAGFIGSFLSEALLKRGDQVVVLDNLDRQVHPKGEVPDYLPSEVEWIQGDIRDGDLVGKSIQDVETVFHLASAVGVGQSQYKIEHYVDVNIRGTSTLLDVLVHSKNRVQKVILAASMSSYGEGAYQCSKCGLLDPPLRSDEQMEKKIWELICSECESPLQPIATNESKSLQSNSIYAITKKCQEEMLLNIAKTYGIGATSLRFFNAYGPRQSLSNPYTGVVAIFLSRLKNKNRPVIYEDGNQTRDFVSVHDVVRAILLASERKEREPKVFNVGSGERKAIQEIATMLSRLCGSDIQPEITERFRKGDVRHCFSDIAKIQRELGFNPQICFEEGMKELIEWSETVEAEDQFQQATEELVEKGLV